MSAQDLPKAYFKARRSKGCRLFIAWGAWQPLSGDCPVKDPAKSLFFEFADSEAEAIAALKEEMERCEGPCEWIRQEIEAENSTR